MNILRHLSAFGTHQHLPASINRQIALCNQIALLLISQAFLFAVANATLRLDILKIATSASILIIFVFVLLCNKWDCHVLGRFLACIVIPTFMIVSQLIARSLEPQKILITQYFGDRVLIMGCTLLPLLLFNPYREKIAFGVSYGWVLACLLLFDPLQWFFNTDIHRANIPLYLQGYHFINITFLVVTLSITFGIAFLKNLNHIFDKQLISANKTLTSQKEEILVQNEELYQKQEELRTQRDYIEGQHFQIKSSIKTAQTIQNAILPTKDKLDELLKNYYVLYLPRDVVSGDFYWVGKVEQQYMLFVADCTGHGVPGAFMTLISHTLLDKIVNVWGIIEPAIILQKLHEEIQKILQQDISKNNMGMDALVLFWSWKNNEQAQITFCGAKLDAYYVLPNTHEIKVLAGTRRAIGGEQNEKRTFENQIINLPVHTKIYLGSDGLADQNNKERKSLGGQRLRSFLSNTTYLNWEKQKDNLVNMLQNYTEGTSQRDDILWIGFELTL